MLGVYKQLVVIDTNHFNYRILQSAHLSSFRLCFTLSKLRLAITGKLYTYLQIKSTKPKNVKPHPCKTYKINPYIRILQ